MALAAEIMAPISKAVRGDPLVRVKNCSTPSRRCIKAAIIHNGPVSATFPRSGLGEAAAG
jgi:hypothetical protein